MTPKTEHIISTIFVGLIGACIFPATIGICMLMYYLLSNFSPLGVLGLFNLVIGFIIAMCYYKDPAYKPQKPKDTSFDY